MFSWDKLPADIISHIYGYDTTYREKLNEGLRFIEHACPTCCCYGGKKTRYRYIIGTDATFIFSEWRRRNACPKHNPSEFDKNGFQIEYDFTEEWAEQDRFDQSLRYEEYVNYNLIILSLWVFRTQNKNIYPCPIKTYSRKKLTGTRFMDMTHSQRPIYV